MAKWSMVTLLERVAEVIAEMVDEDVETVIEEPDKLDPQLTVTDLIEQIKSEIVSQARRDRKGKDDK